MTDASAREPLRAHAFGNSRALTELAGDVVARTLRFHPDTNYPESNTAP